MLVRNRDHYRPYIQPALMKTQLYSRTPNSHAVYGLSIHRIGIIVRLKSIATLNHKPLWGLFSGFRNLGVPKFQTIVTGGS